MKTWSLFAAALLALPAPAAPAAPSIQGDYLEVRTCDIYTGPCFGNAEMNLTGKECILVWSVRKGTWLGEELDGLKVIAVVRADSTLGNLQYHPRRGQAVLIVDERANTAQREALVALARAQAGGLIGEVVETKIAALQVDIDRCDGGSCAKVRAAGLVEISTRCLGGKDHFCGNEEVFYPPLTTVQNATPAYTEIAGYHGGGLNVTWTAVHQRSAFVASFSR